MKSSLALAALLLLSAQKPPSACKLLTPAEVGAAAGAKAGEGRENDIVVPAGPFKGQTMTICTWRVGQGSVTITALHIPSAEKRQAGLAEMQKLDEVMKAQGWTNEDRAFGGVKCSTYMPPANMRAEETPISVGCYGEAKGMTISAGANIAKTKVPMEKVKALVDAAVKRLP